MQRYGERIQALMMNEPWYRENMPAVQSRARGQHDDAARRSRGAGRSAHAAPGAGRGAKSPERRLSDDKQPRHGDAAIAAVLAYTASRMEPEEYEYTPAPPKVLTTRNHGLRLARSRR